MGWRLDDVGRRLSWLDLKAVINLRRDDSALSRSLNPDWRWTLDTQLLAGVADLLAGANWQRGGGKGERPKPLERPGFRPEKKVHKADAIPLDEFRKRLAERRAARSA